MRIVEFTKDRLHRIAGEIVSVDDGSAAVFVEEGVAKYVDVTEPEVSADSTDGELPSGDDTGNVDGDVDVTDPEVSADSADGELPSGTDTDEQPSTGTDSAPSDPPAETPSTSDADTDKSTPTEPTRPRGGRLGRSGAGKPEAQVD